MCCRWYSEIPFTVYYTLLEGASSSQRVAAHMTFLDFVAFGKNAAASALAKLLAAGNKSESCSTLASRVS